MGCNKRILPWYGSNYLFRYYPEEDKDLRRRSCSFRYGASGIPYSDSGAVLRATWERGWSFIKKAGTIITLSTILVWFLSYFGWVDGAFTMLAEDQLDSSILARVGHAIAWIFAPLGFGNWQATVASVTGLVAKGKTSLVHWVHPLWWRRWYSISDNGSFFHTCFRLCIHGISTCYVHCFAAMGAIKREMNNAKWFWIAIGYQCGFAYLVALVINQIGNLVANHTFGIFTVVAIPVIIGFFYLLFRPYKESNIRSKRQSSSLN